MSRTNPSNGIFVDVVDLIDRCTRAKERAERMQNEALENAADSIMSALVLVLGRRRAFIPEELREHYNLIME